MKQGALIPKPHRKKRQPSADELRRQLAAAAERIIVLEGQLQRLRSPWWSRIPFIGRYAQRH